MLLTSYDDICVKDLFVNWESIFRKKVKIIVNNRNMYFF